MLQLSVLLNQKEEIIQRLNIKHFSAESIINEIEQIDVNWTNY
jgi:hypothetical protein